MIDKGIFEAYRKLNAMGFTKEESKNIFYENISCFDRIFGNYFYLNKAIDKVKDLNSKEEKAKEISCIVYNAKQMNMINLKDFFSNNY